MCMLAVDSIYLYIHREHTRCHLHLELCKSCYYDHPCYGMHSRVLLLMFANCPCRHEDVDMWTEVCKYLRGTELIRLSATSRLFYQLLCEPSIWRHALLRDLGLPTSLYADRSRHGTSSWCMLYCAAIFRGKSTKLTPGTSTDGILLLTV
jgi:hypothetical protein